MKNYITAPEKTILWVGDEINSTPPTCLPAAEEIFEYTIAEICGEDALQRIREVVGRHNDFTCKVERLTGGNIFPENMIRELGKIKAVNINGGLTAFDQAPFNQYHCYLALLLEKGVSIVTTNHDSCIQKAYEQLCGEKGKLVLASCHNGVYIYEGTNPNSGKIYYIHGVAENPREIGAHIAVMDEMFSADFRNELKKWKEEGYSLYFVGYGARDIFDVNVYLAQITQGQKQVNWKGYFVSTAFRKDQPQRVKNLLLAAFSKEQIILMTKEEFLKNLCQIICEETEKSINQKISWMMKEQKELEATWKEWMYPNLKEAQKYKDLVLLYVNQSLGVCVEEIDSQVFYRIEDMPIAIRNMYQSLVFRYRYDSIAYYGYVMKSAERLTEEERLLEEELIVLCNDGYNREGEEIRLLQENMEKLTTEYVNSLRCHTDGSRIEEWAAKRLKEINAMLPDSKGQMNKVVPRINHHNYVLLYRIRAALRAMGAKNEKAVEAIRIDLAWSYLYCEQTCNIRAFFKTMEFAGFCYLCFYYKCGKKSYYDKYQKLKTLQKHFGSKCLKQ